MRWLNSILPTHFPSNAHSFFVKIGEYSKSSQVVMPVFFGQADACVVSRSHYETMVELNPQIGHQLHILAHSQGFITGILAMRKDFQKSKRDIILKILQEMHTESKGKQIMTLFRINRLVPFKPEHLVTIEKMVKEHPVKTGVSSQRKK